MLTSTFIVMFVRMPREKHAVELDEDESARPLLAN